MAEVILVPEEAVAKKSALFDVFFRNLPYPLASALVRGIKVLLSIVVPALAAAIADGSIAANIHVIPAGYIPLITAIVSPILISLEKYMRERGLIENDVGNFPTSIAGNGPAETDTLAESPTDIPSK